MENVIVLDNKDISRAISLLLIKEGKITVDDYIEIKLQAQFNNFTAVVRKI
jgi:hypothetical protein